MGYEDENKKHISTLSQMEATRSAEKDDARKKQDELRELQCKLHSAEILIADKEAAAKENEKILNHVHSEEKKNLSAEVNKFKNQLRICEEKVNSLDEITKVNNTELREMRKKVKAAD